jgi:hypothetical protein
MKKVKSWVTRKYFKTSKIREVLDYYNNLLTITGRLSITTYFIEALGPLRNLSRARRPQDMAGRP